MSSNPNIIKPPNGEINNPKTVTFSPIEEHHPVLNEHSDSNKIIKLEAELKQWKDLFIDLVEILTKATPYPSIFIQNDNDRRTALKQLCENVSKKACDPTETKEYKLLENNLKECQNKIDELNDKCKSIQNQLQSMPQPIPPLSKSKTKLEEKIDGLEEILKRQVKNRKNVLFLEKNRKNSRKNSLITFNNRGSVSEFKTLRRNSSNCSFSGEITHQRSKSDIKPRNIKIITTSDENDLSTDMLS